MAEVPPRLAEQRQFIRPSHILSCPVAFPMEPCDTYVGNPIKPMREKTDVLQGTLALMVLKTLDVLGSQHGYGIARRIEQISGDLLTLNQGTLYPVLLRLNKKVLLPQNGAPRR